jgi:integrase
LHAGNYLKRDVLRPAATKAGIEGLTFQALRRTFATHFHGIGTVKDQQLGLSPGLRQTVKTLLTIR